MQIDSSNLFDVHLNRHGSVCVEGAEWLDEPITAAEAVNLAAWLVAVSDPGQAAFRQVLRAIEES